MFGCDYWGADFWGSDYWGPECEVAVAAGGVGLMHGLRVEVSRAPDDERDLVDLVTLLAGVLDG